MPPPPLASVDQVREELKRLGYLDSGLDRFVLGGAGTPSVLKASAAAAVRVGILGGVLLGVALTLAAASLDRRLRSDPRDLAVLFLYLVVLSGAATAVAAFIGGVAAVWAGRRLGRRPGPRLARNVGLGLALAAFAYVALWWWSHASELSTTAGVIAVALGLGVAFLLGRFGALAAVAVLAAGGVGDLPRASLSRHHMLPLLAVAAILLGGGVAAASYLASAAGAEAPDFAVVPTGLRVRVLGIDGLDARMVDQLRGRGELPRLDALLRSGAHARLLAEPEQVPAIVWTTIATSRGPEVHGIQSAGARRFAGMRTPVALGEASRLERALGAAADLLRLTRSQPATSVLRGAKTFWNVASEKGLRVGIVNWWATWPADTVNGYTVTDRALFKIERGGPLDREVYPPAAFDRLKPLATAASEADRARTIDRFCLGAARLLREESPPDIEAVYLPGLDIFTMQQVGDASPSDLPELDARLDAVRAYYRFVDGLVGEVVDGLSAQDVLVLVGDPGRLARRSTSPAAGLLILHGGPVIPADLGAASERDVAPTVLHLAGLPRSRELSGQVLEAALDAGFRRAHPVRTVDTYGRRRAARPAESAFDRDMLEELRSLGYIR
jgi:hypothetical protein